MNGTPTTLSGSKMVGAHAQRIPIAGEDCCAVPLGAVIDWSSSGGSERVYAIDAGEAKQEPSVRTICGGAVRSVRVGSRTLPPSVDNQRQGCRNRWSAALADPMLGRAMTILGDCHGVF